MKTKDRIIREIEGLTEDTLGVVLKFILTLEKGFTKTRQAEERQWGTFALESGAFDFWLDPGEVEYTLDDLKENENKSRCGFSREIPPVGPSEGEISSSHCSLPFTRSF